MDYQNNPSILEGEILGNTMSGAVRTAFVNKVFALFGAALLVTLLGVYAGFVFYSSYAVPAAFRWIIFGIELLMIFTIPAWSQRMPLAYGLFAFFAFLSGVSLIPLLYTATVVGDGPILIIRALTATVATFGAAAVIGWTTKKDLSSLGGMCMVALIGLMIVGLIGLFIPSNTLSLFISGASVLIFTGFTAYDIQSIKHNYPDNFVVMAAMALYLDIFNLFQSLLSILISLSRD
jgi:FtsH-binding integral membrane protein